MLPVIACKQILFLQLIIKLFLNGKAQRNSFVRSEGINNIPAEFSAAPEYDDANTPKAALSTSFLTTTPRKTQQQVRLDKMGSISMVLSEQQ